MVTVASQRYVGALILMNTMMVRAKVFVGDRVSDESIRTFFFGVTHDLPVVSLAVDASNFDSRMVTFLGWEPISSARRELCYRIIHSRDPTLGRIVRRRLRLSSLNLKLTRPHPQLGGRPLTEAEPPVRQTNNDVSWALAARSSEV